MGIRQGRGSEGVTKRHKNAFEGYGYVYYVIFGVGFLKYVNIY